MKLNDKNQFTMFDYTFTVHDDSQGGQEIVIEGMPDTAKFLPKGVVFDDIPDADLEKLCRELISLRAQDIKDIVNFMLEGTEKNYKDFVKLKEFFDDALKTQFADEKNPMKALFDDVKEFPAFYASGADVVGPLRSFDDYIYNGRLRIAVTDIYYPEEKEVIIEDYGCKRIGMHLKLESCATGLDKCYYDFIMEDTPSYAESLYPSFRTDYYFDGKLLASEMARDINGQKRNDVTIYKNNPLADKCENYFKGLKIFDINYSDEIIPQQNFNRIAKDFRESYACPVTDLKTLNEKYPPFKIYTPGGDFVQEFSVYDARNYFTTVKEYLLVNHGSKDIHEGVYPFIDENVVIPKIMNQVKKEYTNNIYYTDTKTVVEDVFNYVYDIVYYDWEDKTISALKDMLNAPCYANRSTEADLIKSGENVVFDHLDETKYKEAIIDNGFNALADSLEAALADEKNAPRLFMNALELNKSLIEFNNSIDCYLVNKNNTEKVAVTLLDANKGNIDDAVNDYNYFKNEFVPKITHDVNNYIKSPKEDKMAMYKLVAELSKIMTQGKLRFETDFFKAPCKRFCDVVINKMDKDATFANFIRYGKVNSGKSFQK